MVIHIIQWVYVCGCCSIGLFHQDVVDSESSSEESEEEESQDRRPVSLRQVTLTWQVTRPHNYMSITSTYFVSLSLYTKY